MTSLRVRRARQDDAEAIAAIYAPFVRDTAVSFETEPPGADEMAARIARIGDSHPWILAEAADGDIAGYAYAGPHAERAAYRWSANVSIYLAAGYRGRGLGVRLYGVLFDLVRRQGVRNLFAGITLPNAASEALHRAMGMSEVGIYRNVGFKFGAWHDVLWLGLTFADVARPVAPPLAFADMPDREIDIPLSLG